MATVTADKIISTAKSLVGKDSGKGCDIMNGMALLAQQSMQLRAVVQVRCIFSTKRVRWT